MLSIEKKPHIVSIPMQFAERAEKITLQKCRKIDGNNIMLSVFAGNNTQCNGSFDKESNANMRF